MGGLLSLAARDTPPPPSVVLVPPLLERDRKGRSRYSQSSYDCLFSQPQLSALFDDYLYQDERAVLHFSPQQEDQHVSVVAKLGVPRRTGAAMAEAGGEGGQAEEAFGSMTLRWQPNTATPLTFFDVKARVQVCWSAPPNSPAGRPRAHLGCGPARARTACPEVRTACDSAGNVDRGSCAWLRRQPRAGPGHFRRAAHGHSAR